MKVKVLVTLWTLPSVRGILQARILEWIAIPAPGDLHNTGIEPRSPALWADYLLSEPPWKSLLVVRSCYSLLVVSMKSKNILLSARNNPISFKMVSPEFRLYCNTIVLLRFSVKDNQTRSRTRTNNLRVKKIIYICT